MSENKEQKAHSCFLASKVNLIVLIIIVFLLA